MPPTKRKAGGPARSASHQADFKKLKRKVGKKAPQKANVANTAFATKSIHVPEQKLVRVDNTQEGKNVSHESSAVTNARSLNLSDLFSQLKHYSVNIRKEALVGLKDLFQRHPKTLTLEVASVFQIILPSLLDEDKFVRFALVNLLQWMLPTLGSKGVASFQGIIISYVCSGLSHMHYAVKRTAIVCLKALIELERPNIAAAGKNASTTGSIAAATTGGQGLNLWMAHAQILPNLLACVQERVFVTRQANIATTETSNSASKGGRGEAAAATNANSGTSASQGSNMQNRAVMLQVVEMYLALSPLARADSEIQSNGHPSTLHAQAVQALMFPDPSLLAATSVDSMDHSSSSSNALVQAATKTVPAKYARKNAQQMKFYSAVLPTATTPTETRVKKIPAINSFLNQLLPLSVEYWLESFGLASLGGSAAGGSASGKGANVRQHDLLQNLLALLKIQSRAMDILRSQKREERREELVAKGGMEDAEMAEEKPLDLPHTLISSLKNHIFSSFPFSGSLLGSSSLGTSPNEHLQRGLQALNAVCCGLIARVVITPGGQGQNSTFISSTSAASTDRRKSGSSQKNDASWLNKIVEYLSTAFTEMTDAQREKVERRRLSFVPVDQQSHADGDAEMVDAAVGSELVEESAAAKEEDVEMEDASEEEEGEDEEDEEEEEADEDRDPTTPARNHSSFGGRQSGAFTPSSAAAAAHTPRTPGRSAESSSSPSSSLSDLLPLLRSILPRLSWTAQVKLIEQGFLGFYQAVHPLSAGKDACLLFLSDFLLSPSNPESQVWWTCSLSLRSCLLESGEIVGLLGVVSAALAQQCVKLEQEHEQSSMQDTPLMRRYNSMLSSLFSLLSQAGRIFSQGNKFFDFNLVQAQLVSFFGTFHSDAPTSKVVPGPFWTLPSEAWQHRCVHLLYSFEQLDQTLLSVVLGCMRDWCVDPLSSSESDDDRPILPFHSKVLLLDMLLELRMRFPGGIAGFITFVMGMVRADFLPPSTSTNKPRVSSLLPIATRMLRSISPMETSTELGIDSSVAVIDVIAPQLAQCIQEALSPPSSADLKLDLYGSLILLNSLVDSIVPPPIASLLPAVMWHILSSTLSGSFVEGGLHIPSNWLDTSMEAFLQDQPWMIALFTIIRCNQAKVLDGLLQLLSTKLTEGGSQPLQVVVVLVALLRCTELRPLLHQHQTQIVHLAATIQGSAAIASQTLLALLASEMTLLFGKQAERR